MSEKEIKEFKEINLESAVDMKIDSAGRVVIPAGKGDIVTLSKDVADEVWRLMERTHALEIIKRETELEKNPDLLNNSTWLADTYNDTKEEMLENMEGFLLDMTLKEFDLEMAYEGGEIEVG